MELEVYVDESGRPGNVKPSAKRRQRLFVIAALAVREHDIPRLVEAYEGMLSTSVQAVEGSFTIAELFEIYHRVTGKRPEVKAGWIVNCQGPFSILRDAPREVRRRLLTSIMGAALEAAVSYAWRLYIIVVDKPYAYAISSHVEEKSGLSFNLRVFALDFLLTRLARLVAQGVANEVKIIHDEVSDKQLILDYFAEATRRGYIYNPKLRIQPDAYRRINIKFLDSSNSPLLQYADLVAYSARALRSGTAPPEEEAIYRQYLCIQHDSPKVVWIRYPDAHAKAFKNSL
jgi:hypothetical protein